jgi:hypothetical protein
LAVLSVGTGTRRSSITSEPKKAASGPPAHGIANLDNCGSPRRRSGRQIVFMKIDATSRLEVDDMDRSKY